MNWIVLKRLHQIYEEGKTRANKTLLKDSEIKFLLDMTKELFLHGTFIKKGRGFDEYYKKHRLDNFQQYKEFLQRNNLEKPQTRFEEKDIQTLVDIEKRMQDGKLNEMRKQFKEKDKGKIEFISLTFFESEKYLLNRPSLMNAVLQLLD